MNSGCNKTNLDPIHFTLCNSVYANLFSSSESKTILWVAAEESVCVGVRLGSRYKGKGEQGVKNTRNPLKGTKNKAKVGNDTTENRTKH